jgi:hypothetical protein
MVRNTIESLRPRPGLVILLLAVGALAALNWRLLAMTIDISPAGLDGSAGPLESAVEAAAVAPFEPKPLSSFRDIEARPLFSPTRRPRAAAAQAAADVPPLGPPRSPPDLRLVGLMMMAPAEKRALIRSPQEPRGRWLSEGGQVDGWNVLTIGANAVVIEGRGGHHELKLQGRRRVKP